MHSRLFNQRRIKRAANIANQVITEQVLSVTQINPCKRAAKPVSNLVESLIEQFRMLARIADLHHRCTLSASQDKNLITSLVTNEYLFCQSDRALTLDELSILHERIEALAKTCHEDVYLIFSSIAVQLPDHTVLNTVIHAQCGQTPTITDVAKVYEPSPSLYAEIYHDKQLKPANYRSGDHPSNDPASILLPPSASGAALNYNHTIECQTSSGARFYRVIDICDDNFRGIGKRSLKHAIQSNSSNNIPTPRQASHVITSASIPVTESELVVPIEKIIHVDSNPDDHDTTCKPSMLSAALLDLPNHREYPTMFSVAKDTLRIHQTHLGFDLNLIACKPMQMATIADSMKTPDNDDSDDNNDFSEFVLTNNTDFSNTTLIDIDLSHRDLSNCNFNGATLINVDLSGANLGHADFRGADLSTAILRGFNISDQHFHHINLEGAKLTGARFFPVNTMVPTDLTIILYNFPRGNEADDQHKHLTANHQALKPAVLYDLIRSVNAYEIGITEKIDLLKTAMEHAFFSYDNNRLRRFTNFFLSFDNRNVILSPSQRILKSEINRYHHTYHALHRRLC